MYKTLSLVTFIIVTHISISQASLQKKLKEVFTQDKVTAILENDSKKQYYENVMFNSYEIKTIDTIKASISNMSELKIITIVDRNSKTVTENGSSADILELINNGEFNILLTNVKRNYSQKTYYQLKNTSKVLVVYSHQDISKK
jgi:hypothetical protein